MQLRRLALWLGSAVLAAGCSSTEVLPDDGLTFDGLRPIESEDLDAAWVRPGFDVTAYDSIMFRGAGIAFEPTPRSGGVRYGAQTRFAMNATEMRRLRDEVTAAFRDELTRLEGFSVVDAPGPATLLLDLSLTDVAWHVPPGRRDAERVFFSEVASASLVLEFRDSLTEAVVVRGIERRTAERSGTDFQVDAAVDNWVVIRRLAESWGADLRAGIEEMSRAGRRS